MNLPDESRAAFIVCTFSMLGKIAEADGHISPEEISRVERYIDRELKLDNKTRALALKVFREAANSPVELREYAERFQKAFPDRVHLLDRMVEILLEVCVADGILSDEEESQIHSAALLLGLNEPGYERIRQKIANSRHASLKLPKM